MSTQPLQNARDAAHPALRLGRYEVRAKIADGGMATVFAAQVVNSDARGEDARELVAIKMIRDEFARNAEFVAMFLDEAKIVSRLRHPNIVLCYEVGTEEGHLFIAMELLCGHSLWTIWDACRARGLRLRHEVVAWIGARVAQGLHYAHELVDDDGRPLDIVHRDVNATNIFVTFDGEIKIIDFGLAKAANRASKTAAGIIKGKVAYMSPEQAVGATVDRRTDVFALGTTLWELSCDRRLFKQDDEMETLKRVHAAEVPDAASLVAGFPPELQRVLERALARDRDRRYQTAAELARELDAFAGGGAGGAAAVAALMNELFGNDRRRQAEWMAEASARGRAAPLDPLKPNTNVSPLSEVLGSSAITLLPDSGQTRQTREPSDRLRQNAANSRGALHVYAPFLVAVVLAIFVAIAITLALNSPR